MSNVLGEDINGRPLRAGDKVRLVGDNVKPQFLGDVHTVEDALPPLLCLLMKCCSHTVVLDDKGVCCSHDLLRINDGDDEQASNWEEVTSATGWTPTPVETPSHAN